MSINISTTSAMAAPASILELAQLVRNAAPESEADPAAFLAALVKQFEALKEGVQTSEGGESPVTAPPEKNGAREDLLQELFQYVSTLDAFSDRQFREHGELPGGNGLPGEGNSLPGNGLSDEDSDSEKRADDPLFAMLAAYGIPSASPQPDSSGIVDGEAPLPQVSAESGATSASRPSLGTGEGMTGEEMSGNEGAANLNQEVPSSDLPNGEPYTHGNRDALLGEQIPAPLQWERLGVRPAVASRPTEAGSAGIASLGVENPETLLSQLSKWLPPKPDGNDSVEPGTSESLISPFDKKLSALTSVSAGKVVEPSMEAGVPLGAMPPASPVSMAAAGDSVPALDKPLNEPGWQEGLGERIVWMNDKNLQTAQIRLNPAHLGPLEIRIQMDQDQAAIHFATHHASVREAIEAAVPMLREMLGAQDIALADVNVTVPQGSPDERSGSFDFNQQSRSGEKSRPFSEHFSENNESVPTDSGRAIAANGMLNLYA